MEPRQKADMQRAVLTIDGLKVNFHTYAGEVKALDGVDLIVRKGEILGLVGESGCGKSVTALSVAGLLPDNAEVLEGRVVLDGQDLLKMSKSEKRMARLKDIAFVFQDPTTYLNPVLTVGSQLTEIPLSNPKAFQADIIQHRLQSIEKLRKKGPLPPEVEEEQRKLEAAGSPPKLTKREFRRLASLRAMEYLRLVKLPDPERVYKMYPFELSGGMKQRAMIAMALIRRPKVLLADEITTALDVTVQAQVLKLLRELRSEIEGSIILITHDMAVVAEICDRVAVMYAGNIVEVAPVKELFDNPLHPYTQGLLASIPRPDASESELKSIAGTVPNLIYPPSGCRFHPRCPKAFDRCPKVKPPAIQAGPEHYVECLLYGG